MRNWIPVSTSPKGRLALAAVDQFGRRRFEEVTVGELAQLAEVTTGALYHHFGSKLGLYAFVRDDVERRVLDRMEGALAASDPADSRRLSAALSVGFDFAVREGFHNLLASRPPHGEPDRLQVTLGEAAGSEAVGRLLAAAWRAALAAVGSGSDPQSMRKALATIDIRG